MKFVTFKPLMPKEWYEIPVFYFSNPHNIMGPNQVHYGFCEMIERASEEVTLFPSDLIGSGTVGFGCILEHGPEVQRWLEPGDEVELEITSLGTLKNKVV